MEGGACELLRVSDSAMEVEAASGARETVGESGWTSIGADTGGWPDGADEGDNAVSPGGVEGAADGGAVGRFSQEAWQPIFQNKKNIILSKKQCFIL